MRIRTGVLYGWRWHLHAPPSLELSPIEHWRVLQEREHSRILVEPRPGGRLAKLARPRSLPRDALRKYGYSQAKREWQAAEILRRLGIQTPRMYAFGFTIAPHAAFESLSVMDFLDDYPSLRDLFKVLRDGNRRQRILQYVAIDLGTIFTNGYLHKDPHFGNVLVDHRDRPVWIDNELRRRRRNAELQIGLSKGVAHLRRSAGRRIGDAEWREFRRQLQTTLNRAQPKRVMHA